MNHLLQCGGETRSSAHDLVQVSFLDQMWRAQLRPCVHSRATRGDELLRVVFVHPPGRNEVDVRVRTLQIFDVTGPSEAGWKEFYCVTACFHRVGHLGGSKGAEEDGYPGLLADFDEVSTKRGRNDEGCTGGDGGPSLFRFEDGAGSDVCATADRRADRLEDVGDREGQLNAAHAARSKSLGEAERIWDLLRPDHRYDTIGTHVCKDPCHLHRD